MAKSLIPFACGARSPNERAPGVDEENTARAHASSARTWDRRPRFWAAGQVASGEELRKSSAFPLSHPLTL